MSAGWAGNLTWRERFAAWLLGGRGSALASVAPVAVGRDGDGLNRPLLTNYGGPADRRPDQVAVDAREALEAWRKNPLARRIVNLITSAVVGDGIAVSSENKPLQRFLDAFWSHPENHIDLRQREWCDELARAGELFVVLFRDGVTGVPQVRTIPAVEIDEIAWRDGDYEAELRYHERGDIDNPDGTWWHHPRACRHVWPDGGGPEPDGPVMLHFAVNRPIGAVRGEGDLAPMLAWLRRYSQWLEDRVRLNAAMRTFLWIVHVAQGARESVEARFRAGAPPAGSIIVADEGAERWEAVTPSLRAADAANDGRALRWMIVAGGPGTSLIDLGEGEDANLATGKAMQEQRHRFLRQRQKYFAALLGEVVLTAYELYRSHGAGLRARAVTMADLIFDVPDVAPEDNAMLAGAAAEIVRSMAALERLVGESDGLRAAAVRMWAKFAGEAMTNEQVTQWVADGAAALGQRRAAEGQRTDRRDGGRD